MFWLETDTTKLLKLLSENNITLDRLTKQMKKDESEIIHKLKKMALEMYNNKKTKEEIKRSLKFISDEQILRIINRANKKKETNNTKNNKTINNTIISMLTEINNKLDIITKNMDFNTNSINDKKYIQTNKNKNKDTDESSNGEDTDDIIDMINRNKR